jgi:hypothetical protein
MASKHIVSSLSKDPLLHASWYTAAIAIKPPLNSTRGKVFSAGPHDTTVEGHLGKVFFMSSVGRSYKQELKVPNAQGYNWATLFLEEINMGTWPSRLGESQI